jgi:macrolide transport system ATP-binding/permease protein
MAVLSVSNLCFSYTVGGPLTLDHLSLRVERGEMVAIRGKSGSGKSTLFHIIGCLLNADSGHYQLDSVEVSGLSRDQLSVIRNKKIGFVFQQFHLLPKSTVLENILLSVCYRADVSRKVAVQKATALAKKLGIEEKLERFPNQLSGGEQQRVVIARALLTDPEIILADEPTGNLDEANAAIIMDLLKELNGQGKTIILITHDEDIAQRCSRELYLSQGKIISQTETNPLISPAKNPAAIIPTSLKQQIRTTFPTALANLRANKIRAVLTMLGVTVGIASLFAMLTFGQFAKKKILEGYQELGANSMQLRGRPNWAMTATDSIKVIFRSFDFQKDLVPLRRIFPAVKLISPILNDWGNSLTFGGKSINNESVAMGVGAEYFKIANMRLLAGKVFSPYHVENRSSVCVIGSEVAERLFQNQDPLRKVLFLAQPQGTSYPCQIIGVLKSRKSGAEGGFKPNLMVYVPYTYFTSVNTYWTTDIRNIAMELSPTADVERVGNAIRRSFEQKYGATGRFSVDSEEILIAQMKRFINLFTLLLTVTAVVTLTVGGVGIHNMMLVSITERLKEIGLRKAVGASDQSIRTQFLTEALILSAVAGLVGVGVGFGAYQAAIYLSTKLIPNFQYQWIFNPVAFLLSVCSIVVVGLVSGIIPALKAERLDVIEALKSE